MGVGMCVSATLRCEWDVLGRKFLGSKDDQGGEVRVKETRPQKSQQSVKHSEKCTTFW